MGDGKKGAVKLVLTNSGKVNGGVADGDHGRAEEGGGEECPQKTLHKCRRGAECSRGNQHDKCAVEEGVQSRSEQRCAVFRVAKCSQILCRETGVGRKGCRCEIEQKRQHEDGQIPKLADSVLFENCVHR